MVAFFVLTGLLLALAPIRLWAALRLMTHFKTGEYTSNPIARRLYIFHMSSGVLVGALVLALTYLSAIWWVEVAGWLFFILVAYRIGQKVRMRLNGSYREFYKSMQWQ